MKQKIYCMIAFILLNILAIIISVYFDHEIFARRFKEFMWVIDLLSMPFFIAYFIVRNETPASETEHLLSNENNARRLRESIQELNNNKDNDKN